MRRPVRRSFAPRTSGSTALRHLRFTISGVEEPAAEPDLSLVRRQLECLAFERLRAPLGPRRQLLYELLCLREQQLLGLDGEDDSATHPPGADQVLVRGAAQTTD